MNDRKKERLNLMKANKKSKNKKCDKVSEENGMDIKQDSTTKKETVSKNEIASSSVSAKVKSETKNGE